MGWVTTNQATPTTMQRVLRVPIGRALALRLSRGYASIQLGKSTDGALSMPLHVTLVTYVPFHTPSASYGLEEQQREFQGVALDFAAREFADNMRKWDEEVPTHLHIAICS